MIPILIRIRDWFKRHLLDGYQYCRRHYLALMRRAGNWLLMHGQAASIVSRAPEESWKNDVLADFQAWLTALPSSPTATEGATPEACDLYTLLAEFSALRQEIKLQNREQHKVTLNMEGLLNSYQESMRFFQQHQKDMDQLAITIRRQVEKDSVLPFLNTRDALVRGLAAAQALRETRSFLRRLPSGFEGVVEGYAMAIRRFDRGLDKLNIRQIATLNQPFNSALMRAVATVSQPEKEKNIVVEEFLSGFMREDEVIRTAEVVVNT